MGAAAPEPLPLLAACCRSLHSTVEPDASLNAIKHGKARFFTRICAPTGEEILNDEAMAALSHDEKLAEFLA